MYPTIFEYGAIVISSYSVLLLIAYFVGYKIFEYQVVKMGYDEKVADISLVAAFICGLGGAKLLFLFQNATFNEFFNDPVRYIASGYSSMGGIFGIILSLLIVARLKKINYWKILDFGCPAILIGYAVGRIGCLLVGDDYGIPTSLPWGIAFPNGSPPTDIPVHPTQLYDTILVSILFVFIWKIRKSNKTPGWLASIGFIILGIQRFLIEFIRTTTPSFIEGISQAQLLSLLVIVIFLIKLVRISFDSENFLEKKA